MQKKSQVFVAYQAFFQCSFGNYLVENLEDDLFLIYRLLTSNITPPITVFIIIAGHNLPIEIDTGASISLLNWETFQKVNYESDISLLPTKS